MSALDTVMSVVLVTLCAIAIMVDGGLLRERRWPNFKGPRQTFASKSERWLHANNGCTFRRTVRISKENFEKLYSMCDDALEQSDPRVISRTRRLWGR